MDCIVTNLMLWIKSCLPEGLKSPNELQCDYVILGDFLNKRILLVRKLVALIRFMGVFEDGRCSALSPRKCFDSMSISRWFFVRIIPVTFTFVRD